MLHRLREYALTTGELGAAASQTVVVVLLPVLLSRYEESALMIGIAIGGEGVFALFVPFVVGALSDHLPEAVAERFGRRGLFLMAAAPLMAGAVCLAPFLDSFWQITAVAFVFFLALHAYTTPLWALMLDAVPDRRRGRVQGARGVFRAGGLLFGLVLSGLLFSIWEPLPFLLAGAIVLASTMLTLRARARGTFGRGGSSDPFRWRDVWRMLRRSGGARRFLGASALWSGAIDGIRPYFFLFASVVVGLSVAHTSLVLGLLILGIAVGSALLGWLGDRFDRGRILLVSLGFLTFAMLAGYFVRSLWPAFFLLFAGGLGAAAVATLPYPIFANIMAEQDPGKSTGMFVFSVSLGRMAAPVLVGAIIDLGARLEPQTRGYPFMWPSAGAMALGGWLLLRSSLHARQRAGTDREPDR